MSAGSEDKRGSSDSEEKGVETRLPGRRDFGKDVSPSDATSEEASALPERAGIKTSEDRGHRRTLAGLFLDAATGRNIASAGFDLPGYLGAGAGLDASVRSATLRAEVSQLQLQIAEKIRELDDEKRRGEERENSNAELRGLLSDARAKLELSFLLSRVSPRAHDLLLSNSDLLAGLRDGEECKAFVMSVDVRRSTELMLKARSPELYAEFLSDLSDKLFRCVVENFGVFDKFTGDGILAFFPETFAGEDASYFVLKAAMDCHEAFSESYRSRRSSFSTVLKDAGLGIGIDYGSVRLLKVAEGLTVVGVPVVYACRLSGAAAGTTLLNQPAFEIIEGAHRSRCRLDETSILIKHEGEVVAYRVSLEKVPFDARLPPWLK